MRHSKAEFHSQRRERTRCDKACLQPWRALKRRCVLLMT